MTRHGGEILMPPGTEAALGVVIGLAGLLVGMAMPTHLAIVGLVRTLFSEGATSFVSSLQGIPRPSFLIFFMECGMTLAVLLLSVGWIRSSLAIARGQAISNETWSAGLRSTIRLLSWNFVLFSLVCGIGYLGGRVGYQAITSGLLARHGGDFLIPSLMGIGGLALWSFTLGATLYILAVSCLGAVVAVAEPKTPLYALFYRAPRIFYAATGWRGLREIALLLMTWWFAKGLFSQLLLPMAPLSVRGQSMVFGVAGALFQAGMTIGDGLVLLVVIVAGAIMYVEGSQNLGRMS